jgi:hypothetical protein
VSNDAADSFYALAYQEQDQAKLQKRLAQAKAEVNDPA